MAYGEEAYGVGGWLALLIFGLLIGGPFYSIIRTAMDLSAGEAANPGLVGLPMWAAIKGISWATVLIGAGASMHAGWRLGWRLRPSSVKIAIWTLWLAGPCITFLALGLMSLISGAAISAIWDPQMLRPLGYAIVWTAYLLKSDRVRNTYVEDDEADRLAATFE